MAKSKSNVQTIANVAKELKSGKILPIYYLFGEDIFSIDKCVEDITKAVEPKLATEFDKEVFHGEDNSLSEALDFASAFPFGDGKKLILFKSFEKVRDKKALVSYASSPSDFTILVLIHSGTVTNTTSEPYATLSKNGYLFSAKELKGSNLTEWLVGYTETKGKRISYETAQVLIDIAGENRNFIEAQLDKIFLFIGDEKEITIDAVRSLSTSLKEFTIFDLQNSIARKDKTNSLKIVLNMLEKGSEPIFIVHMLTRYFTGLSRVSELAQQKVNDQVAARIVGTHPYYYKDYQRARNLYSDSDIYRAVQALLKADLTIKTTSTEDKVLVSLLIAEILQ